MVDWNLFEQKSKPIVLTIGIITVVNSAGYFAKRLDFSALLTSIILVGIWVWTHDTQIARIEKDLKEKNEKEVGRNEQ